MAQAYTVKQLDYFKFMLVILKAAVDKSGVAEQSLAQLPGQLVSSSLSEPAEKIVVDNQLAVAEVTANAHAALFTMVDKVASSAFFNALPWQQAIATPLIEIVTESVTADVVAAEPAVSFVNRPSCLAFFSALPWQTAVVVPSVEVPVAAVAVDVPAAEPIVSFVNRPSCLGFFRALPWQGVAVVPAADVVDEAVGEFAVLPQGSHQSCLTFFQALPWQGVLTAKAVGDDAKINEAIDLPLANSQLCRTFFGALPWQANTGLAAKKMDLMALMANSDITEMAQLATQSAMQSAQRGLAGKQASKDMAGEFFQFLPWEKAYC